MNMRSSLTIAEGPSGASVVLRSCLMLLPPVSELTSSVEGPSFFALALSSFFFLETRGRFVELGRSFLRVGSRPSRAALNLEYRMRAAWPLVISWARMGLWATLFQSIWNAAG